MPSSTKIFPVFVSGALLFCVAGAYLGNWAIAAGQVGIVLSFVLGVTLIDCNRGTSSESVYRAPASLWCLLALMLVSILSMAVNWDSYDRPFKDLKKMRYLLIPVGLFLLPWCRSFLINHSRLLLKNSLKVLVGVVALVTAASFVGLLTGFHPLTFKAPSYPDRISGVFGLSLSFANSLILTFLVLVGILISSCRGLISINRTQFVILTSVLLLLAVGIYYSMSRGAILAVFCGLGVLALAIRSKVLWGVLAFTLVLVIGVSLTTNNMFVNKFKNGIDSTRLAQWRAAGLTFLEHPVVGVGYRQFEKQCASLKEKYHLPADQPVYVKDESGNLRLVEMKLMNSHAHNNYLEAFASTGVLGGLAFLSFIGFWGLEMIRDPLTKLVFLPVIVAFAVAGFFENTFTDSEVLHWIMTLYVGSQLLLLSSQLAYQSSADS